MHAAVGILSPISLYTYTWVVRYDADHTVNILYQMLTVRQIAVYRALMRHVYDFYEPLLFLFQLLEVTMSQLPSYPVQPSPDDDQRQVLAKLQRIYGRRSVAPDVFGRRPALPSEIERLAQTRQQPADPSFDR